MVARVALPARGDESIRDSLWRSLCATDDENAGAHGRDSAHTPRTYVKETKEKTSPGVNRASHRQFLTLAPLATSTALHKQNFSHSLTRRVAGVPSRRRVPRGVVFRRVVVLVVSSCFPSRRRVSSRRRCPVARRARRVFVFLCLSSCFRRDVV